MSAQTAIVIGGGIAGCATAHALAMRNVKVKLIERHDAVASEASGNPFAVLYPRLTGQDTALEALNIHGFLHTLKLINTLGIERCQYQTCGVVQLASNNKLQAQQHKVSEVYKDSALLLSALNAVNLTEIAGVQLQHAGLYFAQAGGINLAHLCSVLLAHPNITLHTNTQALQLKQTAQNSWQVFANEGADFLLEAENIVIANANDASEFSQTAHLPITASRGQLTFLNQNLASETLRTIVCGDGYITPTINGLHTLGATFSIHDSMAETRAADHESNLQLLKQLSLALYDALQNNIVSGRVAWRCQTADYLPACGQLLDVNALKTGKYFYNQVESSLPWLTGLYVNVGHGAKGFLSAPLCAEIIAGVIAKNTNELRNSLPSKLLSGLQPSRFSLREMGFKALAQNLSI